MIKFGYLKGYNSYNVPAFQNASARDNFFDNIDNLVELDAYYPPYFTNVIKVLNSEVPQSQPFNFVILVHNNKYYYYFIDNIQYLDEDIYNVQITLDTTLTYMFDVKIKDCIITRNSINRWINGEINRNYIRENLSEGHFNVINLNIRDCMKWLIIARSTTGRTTSIWKDGASFDIGYEILFIPLFENFPSNSNDTNYYLRYDDGTYYGYHVYTQPQNVIDEFIDDPTVLNIYIIKNESVDKNVVNIISQGQYDFPSYGVKNCLIWGLGCKRVSPNDTDIQRETAIEPITITNVDYCYKFNTIDFKLFEIISSNFTINNENIIKNTNVNTPFNIKYVPQILDENYYQVEYGDCKGFSSYPLHKMKYNSYKLYNSYNPTNSDNIYAIVGVNNGVETDVLEYNTACVSLSSQMELITDAWKTYQAQNKGTLSTGLKLQYTNTLYKTVTSTIKNVLGVSQADAQYEMWGKPRRNSLKVSKLQAKQQSAMGALDTDIGIADGLMQAYNIKKNYDINKENLEYTPDISKGTTSLYSELICKYSYPYIKTLVVEDIETVASKLELYGYKQNKQQIYTSSKTIDTIEKNRYYYNCLEMRINDYELLTFVASDIMNNFIERLSNGVRIFDMSHNNNLADNLIYDNVELEEITNG